MVLKKQQKSLEKSIQKVNKETSKEFLQKGANELREGIENIKNLSKEVKEGFENLLNLFKPKENLGLAMGVDGKNIDEFMGVKINKAELNLNNNKNKGVIIKDGTHLQKGKLKPNIRYIAGEYDYIYETDIKGRICKFETDNLQLTKRKKRLKHDPNTPGKVKGNHAGHLAGDRFGGSPEIDNLVSQTSKNNLSNYKAIENEWAEAIKQNKKVEVSISYRI